MELFDASVWSHSSLHNFLLLKNRQTLLNVTHLCECLFVCFVSPQFHCVHASEEDLEDGLHVVNEHFLEVLFLAIQIWVCLLFPHLEDNALTDTPVADMSLEILSCQLSLTYVEVLWLFLCVFCHPVTIRCQVRKIIHLQNRFFVSNSFSMHL